MPHLPTSQRRQTMQTRDYAVMGAMTSLLVLLAVSGYYTTQHGTQTTHDCLVITTVSGITHLDVVNCANTPHSNDIKVVPIR
jgi:RsiW-degrading membrane proteinase PrsW (M82 family)